MCLFCKIAAKEIPSKIVYEDDTVLAFLDLAQVTEGHTLVIPKKHCSSFLDCDPDTLTHLILTVQKIAVSIKEKTGCAGINILSNCGEAAGQSIEHFHFHILPRYGKEDRLVLEFKDGPASDLDAVLTKLRS